MKKRLLIYCLPLVLLLAGCQGKETERARQQPEILLAQECGFDRLPCCASNPACNFSQQCCADPNDSNRNHCADDCSCGDLDEFCCEGSKCSAGLTCRGGLCVECGGEGDLCCPGEAACSAGLACSKDKCVKCGLVGNPCCSGSEACVEEAGQNNECFEGYCRSCGFDGAPACSSTSPCLAGQLLTGGKCERCGEVNRPCCLPGSGAEHDCDIEDGLICELGFCSKVE